MSRSALYFLLGMFVVTTAGLGFYFYEQRQKADTIEINVGSRGVTIEKN